jgi:hypothetical protein
LDCGSPELAEADHVQLANCTVQEVIVEGPANRPTAYYLVLSAAGSESVDALIKVKDHALAGNSVERYATQVLASDGIEAFRDDTNADSIVFADFPGVADARFVGLWVLPGGQPQYVFPLLLVLGGIGLGVFDVFRLRKKWLSRKNAKSNTK